jgi:hypothetical protein
VLLDDAARPGEQRMLERWLREFPDFERFDLEAEKGAVLLRRRAA